MTFTIRDCILMLASAGMALLASLANDAVGTFMFSGLTLLGVWFGTRGKT